MAERKSHGWELWFGELFDERWRQARDRVKELKAQLPTETFLAHPDVKLFAALVNIVHEIVPLDPDADDFRLGGTLGSDHTSWRRVKRHGLPDRWRLFFRFSSDKRVIVYAWLNDEDTVRKAGAKTDVYTVFRSMLKA